MKLVLVLASLQAALAQNGCYDSTTHACACPAVTGVTEASCTGTWTDRCTSCASSGGDHDGHDHDDEDVECIKESTIASWPAPVNEPCYRPEGACEGYMVCCVKVGTCTGTLGGVTVSSNADYYEGGCYSDQSSKGTTAAGCGGKIGECNAAYLESAKGATTNAGFSDTPPAAVLARLSDEHVQEKVPCQTWDVVTFEVMLDGADASDFSGRGSKTSTLCPVIATAAGVESAFVSCSAEATTRRALAGGIEEEPTKNRRLAAGVKLSAEIMAVGTGVTGASVDKGLATALGTPELATAALSASGYAVTVTTAPTTSALDHTGKTKWASQAVGTYKPPSDGLATGALIGIIAGAAIVLILVVAVVYKFACAKKADATPAKA